MKKVLKGAVFFVILLATSFFMYGLGLSQGSEDMEALIVGSLRQNCEKKDKFTSLDDKWELQCFENPNLNTPMTIESLEK